MMLCTLTVCELMESLNEDPAHLQELLWTLEEEGGWIWTGGLSQRPLLSIRRCCKPWGRLRRSHSDITTLKAPAIQPYMLRWSSPGRFQGRQGSILSGSEHESTVASALAVAYLEQLDAEEKCTIDTDCFAWLHKQA